MNIKSLGESAFKKIVKREEELRDNSPEHTLDWYTFDNRVSLLNEVKGLFLEIPALPEDKKVEDKQPLADVVETVAEKATEKAAEKKAKKVVKDKIPTKEEVVETKPVVEEQKDNTKSTD